MGKMAAMILAAAAVCACARAGHAFQGAAGRTTTNPTGEGGSRAGGGRAGGGRTKTNPTSVPAPLPRPSARLTVHTNLPGSEVEFDGKVLGVTDPRGYFNLPPATSGQHTLVVRKLGYYEFRRVVELSGGPNGIIEVILPPRPGRLRVSLNVPGASIRVGGVGSYDGSVDGVELQPGRYSLSISKLGYAAHEHEVTIAPGTSSNVTLTLIRLPVQGLVAQAESEYQAQRYATAVTLAEMALPERPSDPRLAMLLGISYYRLNNLAVSLEYLGRAVSLGESLTFTVKHFHKLKKGEGFCEGQLLLRRGVLEFRSGENSAENFLVPFQKIAGLRPDPEKGWRVSMQVMLPDPKKKNKKEKGFDYSFHPAQAYLLRKDPRKQNSPTLVNCADCQPTVQFIYQLIQQAAR